MSRRCPWCLEPLPARHAASAPCLACGRELVDDRGDELRPIDLRYEEVRRRQKAAFRSFMTAGVAVAVVVSLILPVLHLAAVAAAPVIVVVHLVLVRVVLLRESRQLLGRRRRFFTRWLSRLAFLWVGVPGWGLAAVPVVGAVVGAGTFAVLTWGAHAYMLLSLHRERRRLPLLGLEKALLVALVVLTVAAIGVVLAGAGFVAWGVAWIVDRLGGLSSGIGMVYPEPSRSAYVSLTGGHAARRPRGISSSATRTPEWSQ